MIEETYFSKILPIIVDKAGLNGSIEKIEIKNLKDEAGFHWSNPTIRQLKIRVNGNTRSFVYKKLSDHSKREVKIYRYLSDVEGFPIPYLYFSQYDERLKQYEIVTEMCIGKDLGASPIQFWKECGILLARIHSTFWMKTDQLPSFFQIEKETRYSRDYFNKYVAFIHDLSGSDIEYLEKNLDDSITELESLITTIRNGQFPHLADGKQCLLHGAFHPPEIMWREKAGKYDQVGVDWERSRIGHPAEDIGGVAGQLLSAKDNVSFQALFEEYVTEMEKRGIELEKDSLINVIKSEACSHLVGSVLPFVLGQYLTKKNETSFSDWRRWAENTMPDRLRFVRDEIINYQTRSKSSSTHI